MKMKKRLKCELTNISLYLSNIREWELIKLSIKEIKSAKHILNSVENTYITKTL